MKVPSWVGWTAFLILLSARPWSVFLVPCVRIVVPTSFVWWQVFVYGLRMEKVRGLGQACQGSECILRCGWYQGNRSWCEYHSYLWYISSQNTDHQNSCGGMDCCVVDKLCSLLVCSYVLMILFLHLLPSKLLLLFLKIFMIDYVDCFVNKKEKELNSD